jgi:threonine dehydrogenase-like Zn-dependent dehydrogenase
MRGVTFKGNLEAEIQEFPDPHAGPGDAVLRVKASGLCGTDLHRYRGAAPTVMITGHEPCGVIEELGPGAPPGLRLGDRVMCHHYAGCGVCEICAMGYEQLCPSGRITFGGGTGHGANADYILVPSRTLVHLPDELSFEEGAAISCGTGTAWNGLRKMDVSGRDTVAVFGQGPVGLSGTLSAKAMGARVIATDVVPERLQLALDMGADHVVNSADTDASQAIRDLTGGAGRRLRWKLPVIPKPGARPWSACARLAGAATSGSAAPLKSTSTATSISKWLPSTVPGLSASLNLSRSPGSSLKRAPRWPSLLPTATPWTK